MTIDVNSDSDIEQESMRLQLETLTRRGANSVDDCTKDKPMSRTITYADLFIAKAIPRARSKMTYPQYINWKYKVLKRIHDLKLSYLLEEENAKERSIGDDQLMSIVFEKLSPMEPVDRNWKALWERIILGLYRGDIQKKQIEVSLYLKISFDGERLDWLSQLVKYEKMANELNMSTDVQVICDRLIIENGWSNRFEWRNLFQNISSLDEIATALEIVQEYNQSTNIQTSAIVSSVDHKNKSSSRKQNRRPKPNQEKDSEKSNKKQKVICYKCKEEGYYSSNCPNQEKDNNNKSKRGRTNKPKLGQDNAIGPENL